MYIILHSFFPYFIATLVLFVPSGGHQSHPVHIIKDIIVSILEDCSAQHYCCVYIFLVFFHLSAWLVPVFQLEYCILTLRICCLPLKRFKFYKSYLWYAGFITSDPLWKLHFCKIPPIAFSFRANAIIYLGTIRRFSWNATTVSYWRFHNNRRMNTSTYVSKFHHFLVLM
jgi:hypothetical protein